MNPAIEKLATVKYGILKVSDKCAAGVEPDRVGLHVQHLIDNGFVSDKSKVVMHKIVRKNTVEIKKALVEMVEHCQVVVTVGWGPFRPDLPMKATEPKIVFPGWVDEMFKKKGKSFVIPLKTFFLHVKHNKHLAQKTLEFVGTCVVARVDEFLTGQYP